MIYDKIKGIFLSLVMIIAPIIYTTNTKEGDVLFFVPLGIIALLGAISTTEKDYKNLIYWKDADAWRTKTELLELIKSRLKCSTEEAERQYNYNCKVGNFYTYDDYKKVDKTKRKCYNKVADLKNSRS